MFDIRVSHHRLSPRGFAAAAANGVVDGQWGSGCHVFKLGLRAFGAGGVADGKR